MSDKSYRQTKYTRNGEPTIVYRLARKQRSCVCKGEHDAGRSIVAGMAVKSDKVQVCKGEPRRN